jgi:hypothetical protein
MANELLQMVLEAHGGLDRGTLWRQYRRRLSLAANYSE